MFSSRTSTFSPPSMMSAHRCLAGTHLTARILLVNPSYPNMIPATVRYVLELRPKAGTQASSSAQGSSSSSSLGTNSELHLLAHAIESSNGDLESIAVPKSAMAFLPFDGPVPDKQVFAPLPSFRASGQ